MRALWLLLAAGSLCELRTAEVRVIGKVIDENQVAIAGARVWIGSHAALTDHAGSFALELDEAGEQKISAQREGFFLLRERPVRLQPGENQVTLVLNNQREVLDSVEVTYSPPDINPEETAAGEQLTASEVMGIPYANTNNLRNVMPTLPGVVQDAQGGVHIQGGSTDQTY